MAEKTYRGVQWNSVTERWHSTVRHAGKNYNCGMHLEQKAAVIARDTCILNNGLKVALQILKPLNKK